MLLDWSLSLYSHVSSQQIPLIKRGTFYWLRLIFQPNSCLIHHHHHQTMAILRHSNNHHQLAVMRNYLPIHLLCWIPNIKIQWISMHECEWFRYIWCFWISAIYDRTFHTAFMHNINTILLNQPIMTVGVFDFALCTVHEIQINQEKTLVVQKRKNTLQLNHFKTFKQIIIIRKKGN